LSSERAIISLVDEEPDDGEEDEIRISIATHEVWMAMVTNVGALLSTRMMSIDYEYRRSLLRSIKYILTKDLVKSLFKGFVSIYVGTRILIYSMDLAYQARQSVQLIIQINEPLEEERGGRTVLKE
jgi:hypothetical protein